VFLPNMENIYLNLKEVAPNRSAQELLAHCWPKFSYLKKNIKTYHLVDTNL
jgi:hypothetical protein